MKLEQQVCSLQLSKKLKELGVKQESLFWWGEYMPENQFKGKIKICTDLNTADRVNYSKIASAFTVAELFNYIYCRTKVTFFIYHNAGLYLVQDYPGGGWEANKEGLADCLAQYIIDKKLYEES